MWNNGELPSFPLFIYFIYTSHVIPSRLKRLSRSQGPWMCWTRSSISFYASAIRMKICHISPIKYLHIQTITCWFVEPGSRRVTFKETRARWQWIVILTHHAVRGTSVTRARWAHWHRVRYCEITAECYKIFKRQKSWSGDFIMTHTFLVTINVYPAVW